MTTYPHETFINMLNQVERILARQEKRSLWIEGIRYRQIAMCIHIKENP